MMASTSGLLSPQPPLFSGDDDSMTSSSLPQQVQPFFLLDWLDDLLPADADPEALAEAFRNVESPSEKKHKKQQVSPLLRLVSHWTRSFSRDEKNRYHSSASMSMPDLRHPLLLRRGDSDLSQDTAASTPCDMHHQPQTPKSSNRRRSRLGRRMSQGDLVRPMRLQDRLDDVADTQDTSYSTLSLQAKRRWQERRAMRNAQKASTSVVQRSLHMAKTWNTRGLEAAQHSNWNQALESWDNALEIYQTLLSSSHTHVANVQNNRGIALGKLQRTDEALQALQRALEIRQNNHDDTATATLTVVTTLHNIANVHQETGNFADALRVLALAKDMLWTTTNNNNNIDNDTRLSLTFPRWHQSARLCTAMGHVYHQAEQWRDAREAYHDALHIYQRLVDFVDAHHTTDRPRLAEPSPPPPPPPRDSLVHELWAVRADLEEMETRRLSMLLLLHDFSHEEKHDEMLDRDREYVPPSPRCCGDATASPATDSVAKASSSVWRRILPTR